MDDNYNAGQEAGRSGTPNPGGGGIQYDLGYIEGKRARERNDGPAGAGIGVLFLSFALWIYPMVGASVGAVGLVIYLGIDALPRYLILALIALAIVAWFFGFKLERRVGRFRLYRLSRDLMRWAVGLYPWVTMLAATGREAPSGAALALYPFVFLFLFWLMKRADRVMGFSG